MRLRDAVVAHLVVFLGILLHHFLLFAHLFFQAFVLFLQGVDDAEFFADEAFDDRTLDIVTGMDGLEKLVEESFEVSLVEVLHGFLVLDVGLCLLQGAVDGLAVVEPLGKVHDFRTYENVAS